MDRVPGADRGRAPSAGDGDRARRCADERPSAARGRVRRDHRPGRPDVLAEPRAAAVLELRRQRDQRLRAVLHGVRVLAHRSARGVRQGAGRAGRELAAPRDPGEHLPQVPVRVAEVARVDRPRPLAGCAVDRAAGVGGEREDAVDLLARVDEVADAVPGSGERSAGTPASWASDERG